MRYIESESSYLSKDDKDEPPQVGGDMALGVYLYNHLVWHLVISLVWCRLAGYSSGQAESRG